MADEQGTDEFDEDDDEIDITVFEIYSPAGEVLHVLTYDDGEFEVLSADGEGSENSVGVFEEWVDAFNALLALVADLDETAYVIHDDNLEELAPATAFTGEEAMFVLLRRGENAWVEFALSYDENGEDVAVAEFDSIATYLESVKGDVEITQPE